MDKIPIRREYEERVFIAPSDNAKIIPKKNDKPAISIGSTPDYDVILEILRQNNFSLKKLETTKVEPELREELKRLGITRPSKDNFDKFLKYINKNKK